MDPRIKRLAKLLIVHDQLKSLHEARRAGFLEAQAQAGAEAAALIRRFDEPDSLSGLFPELYHARIEAAWTREAEQRALAEEEARRLAALTLREKRIAEELETLRAAAERASAERAALEWVEARLLAKS